MMTGIMLAEPGTLALGLVALIVLGVVVVPRQPARQIVRRIQVRQDNPFKLARFVGAHISVQFKSRLRGRRFYSRGNNYPPRQSGSCDQ